MDRSEVQTNNAPGAVGPYSQGIQAGNLVFTAGQIGLDPATGEFAPGGVQAQARRALQNVGGVLEAAGTSYANVVKVTVFLADMGDFKAVNEIYAEFFTEPYPARSAVAVKDLPLGALVEIEAIAVRP
jgi:2-iminobutanoate/2-iminopropanoate deaminase